MRMHHALLLEGSYEWALTRLPLTCRNEGPDVVHFRGARMGIDEVRKLIRDAYQTPLVNSHREFLLAYREILPEAQNALLKLLEEPPEKARFYVITGEKGLLLPTLLSRLVRFEVEPEGEEVGVDAFFRAGYAERLAMIADRAAKKDDEWTLALMNALETWAEKHTHLKLMRAIADLRPAFLAPGASRKMILEHLSLILPPQT